MGIRYRHRVNRLQDPHLHTHYVIGNWAEGPDGRFTALAAEHIYEHAKAGGAVYQLALRSKLRELEQWVEWGPVENGLADDLRGAGPRRAAPGDVQAPRSRSSKPRPSSQRRRACTAARALRDATWRQTRNPKDMTADLGQAWSDEIVTRSSEWLTPADVAAYREMPAFENVERFPVQQRAGARVWAQRRDRQPEHV